MKIKKLYLLVMNLLVFGLLCAMDGNGYYADKDAILDPFPYDFMALPSVYADSLLQDVYAFAGLAKMDAIKFPMTAKYQFISDFCVCVDVPPNSEPKDFHPQALEFKTSGFLSATCCGVLPCCGVLLRTKAALYDHIMDHAKVCASAGLAHHDRSGLRFFLRSFGGDLKPFWVYDDGESLPLPHKQWT